MIPFTLLLKSVLPLIPVFSAFMCLMLVWLSRNDTHTINERKLKQVVMIYFATAMCGWLFMFFYDISPQVIVIGNVLIFWVFISISILFYRIVRLLTRFDEKENFSLLHYIVPVVFCATIFIWSLFVPFDTQMQIIMGRTKFSPDGYSVFTAFYTSKPLMRSLFGLIYNTMIIVLLFRYYKKAHNPESLIRRPARWVIFLIALTLTSYCSTVVAALLSGKRTVASLLMVFVVVSIVMQHLLLTYHIIRRQYLLFVIYKKPEEVAKPEGDAERRQHSGNITQQKLANYFRDEKPYLRADFKITDLVEVFDVSRATISGFINKTYGMNFNRFVNQWRLKEVERLATLPINNGLRKDEYVKKAGFSDRRQYNRVLKAEREAVAEQDLIKTMKGKKK